MNKILLIIIVGIFFFGGGLYMVIILPAPFWFVFIDLVACYIPMALLGWSFNKE